MAADETQDDFGTRPENRENNLLPTEGFSAVDQPIADELTQLEREQLKNNDFRERLELRKRFAYLLIGLLFGQNLATYSLVIWALHSGQLKNLQLIFGILISATLAETAVSVHFMVKHLFSDIDYHR